MLLIFRVLPAATLKVPPDATIRISVVPAVMEAVFTRWDELVGTELGGHLRPQRVDGRVLVVAVEHPAWATRARMESGQILARLRELGETSIDRLEVVVERA